MKRQWHVLQLLLEYSMSIQVQVPAALCALHNFIHRHDPDSDALDQDNYDNSDCIIDDGEDGVAHGELGEGPADAAE
jgi:hypothetical protein